MRRSVLRVSSLAERALRAASSSSRLFSTSSDQVASSNANDYLLGTLPETMKAAVLWEPRKPMTIEDLKMPRPQVGEVLIRTKGLFLAFPLLNFMSVIISHYHQTFHLISTIGCKSKRLIVTRTNYLDVV